MNIPDSMGTLKQEHAQMFSQRSAWRPPARPVYFVSLLSDFWTFLSLQPRCEKILKISGAIDLRRVNSAPAELEALWQSLSGVYKMVMTMRHTLGAGSRSRWAAYFAVWKTLHSGNDNHPDRQVLRLRLKKEKKKLRTELFFCWRFQQKNVEFTFRRITVNY